MFDGRWRASVEEGLRPVGSSLRRTGIKPDHLTTAGLVLAVACAVAVGTGHLVVGVVLLVAAAIPDLLDGAVARAAESGGSARGAFFDSVADRVADALVLGGIAFYLSDTEAGHTPLLPFALLAVSTLVSYERAKAEGLGFHAKGGLMERAERIVALAIGLAFSALLVPVLWLMLALTSITAVHRFVKVWRQASEPRPFRLESRWRAWRDAAAVRGGARDSRLSRRVAGDRLHLRRRRARTRP